MNPKHVDRTKSLEELEGVRWGEPTYDSYVVRTSHALRRKPLKDLTVEELRLAIGQEIGWPWLVPIALEHLSANPMVSGDLYDGDLLAMVLRVSRAYWTNYLEERRTVENIAAQLNSAQRKTLEVELAIFAKEAPSDISSRTGWA